MGAHLPPFALRSKVVRKGIARVLTVYNQTQRVPFTSPPAYLSLLTIVPPSVLPYACLSLPAAPSAALFPHLYPLPHSDWRCCGTLHTREREGTVEG